MLNETFDTDALQYEIDILKEEADHFKNKALNTYAQNQYQQKIHDRFYEGLTKLTDFNVSNKNRPITLDDETHTLSITLTQEQQKHQGIPKYETTLTPEQHANLVDYVFDCENHLIRFSESHLATYSPLRVNPDLSEYVLNESGSDFANMLNNFAKASVFRDHAEEIIEANQPYNTRKAYHSDLVYWVAWCRAMNISLHKPLDIDAICSFIIQHAEGFYDPTVDKRLVSIGYKNKIGPHKLATVRRRIISLSIFLDRQQWPNPTKEHKVRTLLKSLTKKYGGSKPVGRAITKDILELMLDTCSKRTIRDIRDKAILLFAWSSGGRRRSEIVAARMDDFQKDPDGSYIYTLPKSKTDQEQKGCSVPIKGTAARALDEWIKASGINQGPLFRSIQKGGLVREKPLSGTDIYRIVKQRLKYAGLDPSLYSAHGLRSGFVTEAGRRNKPIGDVMALTTHKSHQMLMHYYRSGNAIHNSAADLIDE